MVLNDKHVVLTGASSGIGREMARVLGPRNRMDLLGRDVARLERVAAGFPDTQVWRCDLGRRAEVEATGRAMRERDGSAIDVIVLNAAVQFPQALSSLRFDRDAAEAEFSVNLISVCWILHLLLPRLVRGSRVVLVNSGLALAPKASAPIYCASKAALRSLGQSLSHDLAPRGICLRQIYLPLVETPMTAGRGSRKMPATDAGHAILKAIAGTKEEVYVGRCRALWWISRVAPRVARKIMAKQ